MQLTIPQVKIIIIILDKRRAPNRKSKPWWKDQLNEIYKEIKSMYASYKNTNRTDTELNKKIRLKKDKAIRIKRLNMRMIKEKCFSKIDLNYKHKTNEFWRLIKKKINVDNYIEASINEQETNYKNHCWIG